MTQLDEHANGTPDSYGRGSVANLTRANARRTTVAAARDVATAQSVLNRFRGSFWPWPPAWRQIAEARVALPEASWAELGEILGMTKDQVASDFRRLRQAMEAGDVTIRPRPGLL